MDNGNVFDQLKRDEGLRLKPYRDSVGKLTIGYGRNLDDNGVTEEEAAGLLYNDIVTAKQSLAKHLPWFMQLDDARRGVLINMAFNLGIWGLLSFKKFLASIQSGDYATAKAEMLNSRWAEQVGARAQRLAIQMETGKWQ
jgi:lysozyme